MEFGLPSLLARRMEIDMVQTYKIVNKVDTDDSDQWFDRLRVQTTEEQPETTR